MRKWAVAPPLLSRYRPGAMSSRCRNSYARLAALTSMTLEGLDQRGLLTDLDRESLTRLQILATSFQKMAEKELAGQPLTQEEYDLIRFYGGDLEHLVMASADTDNQDEFAPRYHG